MTSKYSISNMVIILCKHCNLNNKVFCISLSYADTSTNFDLIRISNLNIEFMYFEVYFYFYGWMDLVLEQPNVYNMMKIYN